MKKRCLYCYRPLENNEIDFHPSCSKKMFSTLHAPLLPFMEDKINEYAKIEINNRITVQGVQPKLSLGIEKGETNLAPKKFTIMAVMPGYIFKPPSNAYPELPEIEDLTMHLASLAKINVVPHSLIRMQEGNLAYIVQRIDRKQNAKIHMEDMCQLTENMTEHKYRGSYELIARTINKYSTQPGLDVIDFFEQVLFSFLTGNADMHLKNFSLINQPGIGYILAPAYDLVATALVNKADNEELALTLNEKKRKIIRADFTAAFNNLKLNPKQQENIYGKMEKTKDSWLEFIDISFLSTTMKSEFKDLIKDRFSRLSLH